MFLIDLRTIAFLFYLIREKKKKNPYAKKRTRKTVFHSHCANKASVFLDIDQFAYMRPLSLERIKQYMVIFSSPG